MKKIAITMGDPSGIGPEIILKALNNIKNQKDIILIGNRDVFSDVSDKINIKINKDIEFIDISCDLKNIKKGFLSKEAGKVSYLALKKACDLVKENKVQSIVTAPVCKEAVNMAGYHYSGQTEILETMLGHLNNESKKAEMLFVSGELRTLLLTRHLELASTSKFLTKTRIIESILALNKSLINNFNIKNPKIAICAFNPHAGENGILGQEEIRVIIPAVNELKEQYGINIDGPYPADTLWAKAGSAFLKKEPQPYDAYAACYHDQGLIPVKLLAMDKTVNTTINLSVLRTSPAHGTAFDIANSYIAKPDSMQEAIELAIKNSIVIKSTVKL